MKQIQFTISAEEIREQSQQLLSDKQVDDILTCVENDEVLWNSIKDSINSAIGLINSSL
jgi:hypothetical protein